MAKLAIFLCTVLLASTAHSFSFTDSFNSLRDKATNIIGTAVNNTKEVAGNIAEKASEVRDSISETIQEDFNYVKEKAKNTTVAAANVVTNKITDVIKDTVEGISDKIISGVSDQVNEQVSNLMKTALNLQSKVITQATQVGDKIREQIQNVTAKAANEMLTLASEAGDADLSECTGLAGQLVLSAENVLANTSQCITDKITEGTGYVTELLNSAQETRDSLDKIGEERRNCEITSPATAITCASGAVHKASATATSVVPAITTKIGELNFFFMTLQTKLTYCMVTKGFGTFFKEAMVVIDETRKCIKGKIAEGGRSTLNGIRPIFKALTFTKRSPGC